MKGDCKELYENPEKIKRQYIRFIDENECVCVTSSLEVCEALAECELSQEEFLDKADIYKPDLNAFYNLIKTTQEEKSRQSVRGFGKHQTALIFMRKLGKALRGDENAFLHKERILTPQESALLSSVMHEQRYEDDVVKAVYHDVIGVCNELAMINYYEHQKGDLAVDLYYMEFIDKIRGLVDTHSLNIEQNTLDKLYRIIDEMYEMIWSCDFPDVSERWFDINPRLKFYDCVFDFYFESPMLFDDIVSGRYGDIHFKFIPTQEELKLAEKYYTQMSERRQRLCETEEMQYQREVITAVRELFKQEFYPDGIGE